MQDISFSVVASVEEKKINSDWRKKNEQYAIQSELIEDERPIMAQIIFDKYAEMEMKRLSWKRKVLMDHARR